MAFYTILSLAPFVVVVLTIAGLFFEAGTVRVELTRQVQGLIGSEGATTIESLLANAGSPTAGFVASAFGILMLVVGATGVFVELQDVLDTIWESPPSREGLGVWAILKDRFLSFAVICGFAFLLLVSLVFSAALVAAGGVVSRWMPETKLAAVTTNFIVSFVLTVAMFAMIYKLLPPVRPRWSNVWIGALATAGLFAIGKMLISLYLGSAAVGSAYGAAGSLVVLLVWVYYSTQILLFGAEVTRALETHRRSLSTAAEASGSELARDSTDSQSPRVHENCGWH